MKAIRIATSLMLFTTVIACQNKPNEVDSSTRLGAGPTGSNAKIEDCQVGQIFDGDYGCLSNTAHQCPEGQGFARSVNMCVDGKVVTEKIALGSKSRMRLYGRLKLKKENIDRFEDMLKDAEVCGIANSYNGTYANNRYGVVGANNDCLSLIDNGAFILIDVAAAKKVNVTIGAGTILPQDQLKRYEDSFYQPVSQYGQYGAYNQYYVTFSQKAEVSPYNYGNGVKLLSIPSKVGLRVEIPAGSLSSEPIQAYVYYGSTEIGSASIRRDD